MPCWQSATAADHSGVPAAWSVSKGMLIVQSGSWCHCSPHVAGLCVSFKLSLSPYLRHPAHWTILAHASLRWRTDVFIASCCGCSRQIQMFLHANSPPHMQAGSSKGEGTAAAQPAAKKLRADKAAQQAQQPSKTAAPKPLASARPAPAAAQTTSAVLPATAAAAVQRPPAASGQVQAVQHPPAGLGGLSMAAMAAAAGVCTARGAEAAVLAGCRLQHSGSCTELNPMRSMADACA